MKLNLSVLSDFIVAAGTFSNILVQVHLDNAYGRNDFNDTLYDYIGLPTDIDYAVTHVRLWALGIGQILELDIDSASGNRVFQYELAATSVPLPAAWFLFGSGVIGLFGVRRFF